MSTQSKLERDFYYNYKEIKDMDKIKIKAIDGDFSVCKVKDYSKVNLDAEFCFTGKTDEEKSLVCYTEYVPGRAMERDDGRKALRGEGILGGSLIGILSQISALLAENEIGIFAISTYNTDYILVKEKNYLKAKELLI